MNLILGKWLQEYLPSVSSGVYWASLPTCAAHQLKSFISHDIAFYHALDLKVLLEAMVEVKAVPAKTKQALQPRLACELCEACAFIDKRRSSDNCWLLNHLSADA